MKQFLVIIAMTLLYAPLVKALHQTAGSSAIASSSTAYNQDATEGILKLIENRKGGAGVTAGEDIDIDALKKLLKAGANPNARIGKKDYTLLHWAISVTIPTLDFYKTMIAAGANPLAVDYKGRTPLQFLRSGSIFKKLKTQIKNNPDNAKVLQATLDKLEAVAAFLKEAEIAAKKEAAAQHTMKPLPPTQLETIAEVEEENPETGI